MRVSLIAEDDTELSVEVDGAGVIRQIYRIREDGSERRTYARRLTDTELEEIAHLTGLDVERDE